MRAALSLRSTFLALCGIGLVLIAGCGSNTSMLPLAATPVFTPAGGTYTTVQSVTISSATAGAAIYYTGDGTTPTTASSKYSEPITVSANQTLEAISVATSFTNSAVATAQYVLNYPPPTVSAASYTFASDIVGNAITQTVATVTNPATTAVTLSTAISGDPSMTLVAAQSCGSQLAAGASCPIVVQYLPTAVGTQTSSVSVAFSGDVTGSAKVALSGAATLTPTGTVAATTNPLVALYTITPGFAANVTIQFGLDTTYGYTTSAFPTPTTNSAGAVSIEVGGMRAKTLYHMRAQVTYADGTTVTNADQTFTTGSLPADLAGQKLTVTTAAGMTPQPGIEVLDPVIGSAYHPYATDLQGNIIWYYPWADYPGSPYLTDGIKQLSDGNFVAVLSVNDSVTFNTPADPTKVVVREFDLIGNTIKQITVADLNPKLAAAGYTQSDGSALTIGDLHHDVTPLPNGHWLILSNTTKVVNNVNVLGDVVIDLDTNLNPVFVWNEFDHFQVSRQPLNFPDWTHSNAIVYTPTDGNFLVSIRHQSWVVKVSYQNGAGDGSVLWRLGYQGDFTLVDTVDPLGTSVVDWQYAQHGPSIVGTASAGVFDLVLMDNGNDRIVPGNLTTCPSGETQDCYTTVPIFQIDENAKTATVESRFTLPTSLYSDFGGNAEVLANNDLEFDLAGPAGGGQIMEVQQDSAHTPVWSFVVNGGDLYRGFRLPSLYQGVQWP